MKKEEFGMLVGLFFAKYEKKALEALGFAKFTEAFNTLSLTTNINNNSLRNYRDEFSPLFDTARKGWKDREIRNSRIKIYEKFKNLSIFEFVSLIQSNTFENNDLDFVHEDNLTYANRLITGEASEQYFINNYQNIDIFKNCSLENTTKLGCGFDFKLNYQNNFFAIEVKGLNKNSGNISITKKEFQVASKLKDNYFIFGVKNFIKKPEHLIFQNPLFSNNLLFNKNEIMVKQISYNAFI